MSEQINCPMCQRGQYCVHNEQILNGQENERLRAHINQMDNQWRQDLIGMEDEMSALKIKNASLLAACKSAREVIASDMEHPKMMPKGGCPKCNVLEQLDAVIGEKEGE